ncbi:MAG: hypothetical protein OEZ08_14770, partial [Betaproteobacteria bacterium]|nr:hypothetical protein [Betaproteobacteria bacterium]
SPGKRTLPANSRVCCREQHLGCQLQEMLRARQADCTSPPRQGKAAGIGAQSENLNQTQSDAEAQAEEIEPAPGIAVPFE